MNEVSLFLFFFLISIVFSADFRVNAMKQLSLADNWKKLMHVNVVQLRDVIQTRQFGDHCKFFTFLKSYFGAKKKSLHPSPVKLLSTFFLLENVRKLSAAVSMKFIRKLRRKN